MARNANRHDNESSGSLRAIQFSGSALKRFGACRRRTPGTGSKSMEAILELAVDIAILLASAVAAIGLLIRS